MTEEEMIKLRPGRNLITLWSGTKVKLISVGTTKKGKPRVFVEKVERFWIENPKIIEEADDQENRPINVSPPRDGR